MNTPRWCVIKEKTKYPKCSTHWFAASTQHFHTDLKGVKISRRKVNSCM